MSSILFPIFYCETGHIKSLHRICESEKEAVEYIEVRVRECPTDGHYELEQWYTNSPYNTILSRHDAYDGSKF